MVVDFNTDEYTLEEGMQFLQALTPNELINLNVVPFGYPGQGMYNIPLEMQELILEKKSNIYRLSIYNAGKDNREYLEGFNFLVQFVQTNNGDTKHIKYVDIKAFAAVGSVLKCFTKLANALLLQRSNNNNNRVGGDIESFSFASFCTTESFQILWNALLDIGVPDIELKILNRQYPTINDPGCFDFSNLSTNTTVKKLKVYSLGDWNTNLYDSIEFNETLETLIIKTSFKIYHFSAKEKTSIMTMLRGNISLLYFTMEGYDDFLDCFFKREIQIQTQLNWMWKRYIMKCKERDNAAAAAAAIHNIRNNVATVDVEQQQQQQNEEENNCNAKIKEGKKMKKRKEEMCVCLLTFAKKPLIRNELIFSYLRQNDDMYDVQKLHKKKNYTLYFQNLINENLY